MNCDLQRLNDIFTAVQTTLIERSQFSLEEFNHEFDELKHFEGRQLCDDDYYEILVKVIFYSGFRAATVDKYMPSIMRRFPDYKTVMGYGKEAFNEIANADDMIKNTRKINACIDNAERFDKIVKEHGSFESYINLFAPGENDGNLFRFKKALEKFDFIGPVTAYHFMKDIGLNVIKPDIVLMRIFKRLGFIKNPNNLWGAVKIGRQFREATNLPIQYIDFVFVLYGQLNIPKFECICSEKKPNCGLCGVSEFCRYFWYHNDTGIRTGRALNCGSGDFVACYSQSELEETRAALSAILTECEMNRNGKEPGISQQTLPDGRVRALRLALQLIESEMNTYEPHDI